MKTFIDFAALKKCYATAWSYGEICVGCNCCGRFEKGMRMWEARLKYHQEELERIVNFADWFEDPKMIEVQKANIKINIAYHKTKIRNYNKVITRLKK